MYDFDEIIERKKTSSTKWDRYEKRDGLKDIIPLWVADMDFACLPDIRKAIIKRANHLIYGYTDPSDELFESVIEWEKRHHQIIVERSDIIWNTGVVYGIHTLIDWLVDKEEKVIVQTPVYPPFFNTPKSLNRGVVFNPLKKENRIWKMDLEDFENKLKEDASIKMFILCNPHNPVGRCYSKEELEAVLAICEKYNLYVVSDEIHADIVMPGKKHVSILSCDKRYHERIFLLGSATKSFNLAGLKISYAIVKNHRLKEQFAAIAKSNGLSSINIFGMEAMIAAYKNGDEWLNESCEYIYQNFLFLKKFFSKEAPMIEFDIPEATYLAWVDLSSFHLNDDFNRRLKYEGHVELQGGVGFGENFKNFQRINLACPRSVLEEGMNRMINWLRQNKYL